eukprot:TRINITY_DN4178_c0_g1_i1.p3 TRINITY_DN4178_c0_g1~~TRINITY_DN4178_c0_g1_i1.p3  ORF type:complete len:176 (-),score=20.14 TRINITY_DN4178_c0_g1_i1:2494-3021(-)
MPLHASSSFSCAPPRSSLCAIVTSKIVSRAFVAAVLPHSPVTSALAAPMPSSPPSAAASTGAASSRGLTSATTSAWGSGHHRHVPTASIVTSSLVQTEMERLGRFVAATAAMSRALARAVQAAGVAWRASWKEIANVRVSVYLSGVTPTGEVNWLILHGSAVSNDPELMRLEAQV